MVIINNRDWQAEAQSLLESNALRYGEGFFTTTAIRNSIPLWLEDHIKRLQASLSDFGMGKIDDQELTSAVYGWIQEQRLKQGFLRIMTWSQAGEVMVYINGGSLIEGGNRPVRLDVSKYGRHSLQPLLGYKSFNYWANNVAYQEALKNGCEEVVWLNERGEICEGSRSNLFWVQDGIIYTPDKSCGMLPGIARQIVLELAGELDLPTRIGSFQLPVLTDAHEIFLTNSVRGIRKVVSCPGGSQLKVSPVTDLLIQAYDSRVTEYALAEANLSPGKMVD